MIRRLTVLHDPAFEGFLARASKAMSHNSLLMTVQRLSLIPKSNTMRNLDEKYKSDAYGGH